MSLAKVLTESRGDWPNGCIAAESRSLRPCSSGRQAVERSAAQPAPLTYGLVQAHEAQVGLQRAGRRVHHGRGRQAESSAALRPGGRGSPIAHQGQWESARTSQPCGPNGPQAPPIETILFNVLFFANFISSTPPHLTHLLVSLYLPLQSSAQRKNKPHCGSCSM